MDDYRSPIRLMLHAGESPTVFNAQSMNRARKKLLAELSLSGNELSIGGFLYGRNDIVTLLDPDKVEANWLAHLLVYDCPPLLRFLEEKKFEGFDTAQLPTTEQLAPVSPYFAHSFDAVARPLLRQQNFSRLCSLLAYQHFIDPVDSNKSYHSIRLFFDDINYQLRNLNWEKYAQDKSVLDFLYINNFSSFINSLPPSFNQVRDSFITQMILLTERLQQKETWKNLHRICERLQGIECSPQLTQEVDKFEGIMRKNSKLRLRVSKEGGRGVWAIIWVVVIIIRLVMSGSSDSGTRYGHMNSLDEFNSQLLQNQLMETSTKTLAEIQETNVKRLMMNLAGKNNIGTTAPQLADEAPFPGISHLPDGAGSAMLTVVNRSGQDMVVMGFMGWQSVFDTVSKFMARHVPRDSTVTIDIDPEFTRINFATGNGWLLLRKPITIDTLMESQKPRLLKAYFKTTPKTQEYLESELLFTRQELAISDNRINYASPMYTPSKQMVVSGPLSTTIQVEKDRRGLVLSYGGDLYIYQRKDVSLR